MTSEKKTTTINLRMPLDARNLIDYAARIAGKTRTEFLVEAARREAENTLLDQRLFLVSDNVFKAFTEALDQPPGENPGLRELLQTPAPWEQ